MRSHRILEIHDAGLEFIATVLQTPSRLARIFGQRPQRVKYIGDGLVWYSKRSGEPAPPAISSWLTAEIGSQRWQRRGKREFVPTIVALDVSITHIPKSDATILGLCGELNSTETPTGWWLQLPFGIRDEEFRQSLREHGLSKDTVNLLVYAWENGCTWLRLDSEGSVHIGLPTFDW